MDFEILDRGTLSKHIAYCLKCHDEGRWYYYVEYPDKTVFWSANQVENGVTDTRAPVYLELPAHIPMNQQNPNQTIQKFYKILMLQ